MNKVYQQAAKALKQKGLSPRQISLVLSEYIESDKLGKYSHGAALLPILLKRLEERQGPVKLIMSRGAMVYLEGNKELGQLAADYAIKLIVSKAKKYGVGFVGLRNLLPFLRPGTYARILAEKNLISLVMNDGGGAVVTHPDSPEPVIGTNPIAFGVPTSQGPLVVDMATAKRAWAEVRYAREYNALLPANSYKDRHGKFTRDPKKAFSAVPFGDYKGFALGIMVEILANGLLSMIMGKHKKKVNRMSASRGAVFIAIDPSRFIKVDHFKKDVTKLLQQIKAVKKNKGIKNIRLPGESALLHI